MKNHRNRLNLKPFRDGFKVFLGCLDPLRGSNVRLRVTGARTFTVQFIPLIFS